MVKNPLVIVSHMLIIKYLDIIPSNMLTKRSHRSVICPYTFIHALRSIIWSHTVIIHPHTLTSPFYAHYSVPYHHHVLSYS